MAFGKKFGAACLVLASGFVGLAGCGEAVGPTGGLKGKITLGGAAPPAGCKVQFMNQEKGVSLLADVGADGSYTATYKASAKVPVGMYKGMVMGPPTPVISVEDASRGVKPPASPIPGKYGSDMTSGLSVEVKEGAPTVYDFDMAP